jgi:hypothetical protein
MTVFDLRIPLGYLFATLGALLIIAGLIASPGSNSRSLGINVNIIWGAVMIAFGILCLLLAKREARRRKRAAKS